MDMERNEEYRDEHGLVMVRERPSALNDSASYTSTVGQDADAWLASVGQSQQDDVAKYHLFEAAAVVLEPGDMNRLTALCNDFTFDLNEEGRWVAGSGGNPHVHADVAWLPVYMPLPVTESASLRTGRNDPSWVFKAVLDPASGYWMVVKCTVSRIKAATLAKRRQVTAQILAPEVFAARDVETYARLEAAAQGRVLGAKGTDHLWFTPEVVHVCGDEDLAVETARHWAGEIRDDYLDAESHEYAGFGGMFEAAPVRHSGAQANTWPFSGERLNVLMRMGEADPLVRVLDEVDAEIERERLAEYEAADWADVEAEEWAMARDAEWADA